MKNTVRYILLFLCFLLIIQFSVQDKPRRYKAALRRIQEAAESGATSLDLSNLRMTHLPSEIGQLVNLESLSLHFNVLRSLPPEIGQLRNLRGLYLDHNLLASLPPEIGQLSQLQHLSLSYNRLTNLPSEIGQLTNLQRLNLDHNRFQYLPVELTKLNLTCSDCYLGLSSNPLIPPQQEVVEQGTVAVQDYLYHQAELHAQHLIIKTASGVGLLAALILGVRYRQHRRKPKAKRGLA